MNELPETLPKPEAGQPLAPTAGSATWCGLKDDPTFVQCCCNCKHLHPVHYHRQHARETQAQETELSVTLDEFGVTRRSFVAANGAGVVKLELAGQYIGHAVTTKSFRHQYEVYDATGASRGNVVDLNAAVERLLAVFAQKSAS